jgi:prepilin-type N-terminal cleavage/methylation domain-containing protein
MSPQPFGGCNLFGRLWSSRRLHSDRQPRGDEGGFTLVELLVVVVIIPLVIGAISVALISVMTQQTNVSNKVSDSQDTQVVSATFVQDVQSASQITTSSTVNTPIPCGAGTPILSLLWGSSPQTVVSYDVVQQGSHSQLFRYGCANGGSTTPTNGRIIAHDVQSSLAAAITGLSCPPAALSCSPMPAAAASGWTSTAGVAGVTLSINSGSTGDKTYNYSLTGVPRASTSSSRGSAPPGHATALTLGASGTSVSCSGSSNAGLSIDGSLQINSTSSTVASTNNNASISANSIDTGSTSSTSLSGNVNPATPSQTGVTVTDPYAGLTPPVTGLQTATLTPGGTYQGFSVYGGAYSGPGIYTSTLTFPNGTTTMASGVYILMSGISLSGQQNLDGTAGVLLYVFRGSVSLTGQGQATLAPFKVAPPTYSGAPNPWPGIVIWQDGPLGQGPSDAGDSNNVALAGNGVGIATPTNPTGGNLVAGTVYAPSATAGTSGNGALTVGSIVAASIACGGNGAFTIG